MQSDFGISRQLKSDHKNCFRLRAKQFFALFYFPKLSTMKKWIFMSTIAALTATNSNAQQISNPPGLFDPTPYGFSHVATVPAGSKLIFVAGQGGEENTEGKLSKDFAMQVEHALNNIKTALTSQGVEMKAVVKVTTLVVDHDQEKLKAIIAAFEKVWPDKKFPVNTLIPVPRLALDNMLVEIDAVAVTR